MTCDATAFTIDNANIDTDVELNRKLCTDLTNLFEYPSFKPYQLEAIKASLSGHNCFIQLPPNAGKSLC
jgi:superfamily II DNA helicase RecQ